MPQPDPTDARAADHLARRLHDAGCRHAFGMPGGEVLTVMDALARAGIEVTLARHENAAAFMAEGVWHRTGAPGILLATLGPGVLNGVNAIANAHQDRVPLIVISGCVDADEALTYSHQILDHEAVLAPVTKATFRLTAQGCDIIADKAVGVATEGRPGPVHIDVPISVADTRVTLPRLRHGVAIEPCRGVARRAGRIYENCRDRPREIAAAIDAEQERERGFKSHVVGQRDHQRDRGGRGQPRRGPENEPDDRADKHEHVNVRIQQDREPLHEISGRDQVHGISPIPARVFRRGSGTSRR